MGEECKRSERATVTCERDVRAAIPRVPKTAVLAGRGIAARTLRSYLRPSTRIFEQKRSTFERFLLIGSLSRAKS